MDDSLCRVSVQCGGDEPRIVDLALPRRAQVGVLLPSIVDLVLDRHPPPPDSAVCGWRLDRLRGGRVDESMTLSENGIHDGDVIMLSVATAPAPGPLPDDPYRAVAAAPLHPPDRPDALPAAACIWCACVAAGTLAYSGVVTGHALAAAVVAALTSLTSALAGVHRADTRTRPAITVVAVIFACACGYLVVPSAPGTPNIVLAASTGCMSSILIYRLAGCGTVFFTAAATGCGLLAAVTAVAVAIPLDMTTVGVALVMASLCALGGAPRWAMMIAGLGPAFPGRQETELTDGHAEQGRALLAGIVAGSAAAAAAGTVLAASGCLRDGEVWPASAALTGAVAGLLLLRARFYSEPVCRTALACGGLVSGAMSFAVLAASAPLTAGWAGVLTAGITGWCYLRREAFGPVLIRGMEFIEYALLAAVVPLACWVAGVYGMVRSLSMP